MRSDGMKSDLRSASRQERLSRERAEMEPEEYMSKLRIDFIDDDVAPQDIRGLLAKFGKVKDVSIHAGQDCTYALADMLPKEAEEATDQLHGRSWRGTSISVVFANRAGGKPWLSGHDWKPPKRERW